MPEDNPHSFQEIRGVPAYSSHTGIRYTGGILFRVGRADETARTGGLCHLVEHLALFGLGPHQPYGYNGSVAGLSTGFHATGSPEEVGRFLTEVARALRALPIDRLADEARVLRTEASRRPLSPREHLLGLRYGATSHGLSRLPEYALVHPDAELVKSWAAERFTAGNAALWFTGPPPPGLALDLQPGSRFEAPKPVVRPDVRFPTWVKWDQNLVAVSFVGPRTDMLNIILGLAARRVSTKLRYERGVTYEIQISYEPVTRDDAHAALWASCLPENARSVRDGIIDVFDDLAAHGAGDEELAQMREGMRRAWTDPAVLPAELSSRAMNDLLGFETKTWAEFATEVDAIDSAQVARGMSSAQKSALLLMPTSCTPPDKRFSQFPPWSAETVSGKVFRSTAARFPWSRGARLVIGREGVSLVSAEQQAITVKFASCAVATEEKNGTLELVADRGTWVRIAPERWRRGSEAVSLLRGAIPPDRIVRLI